MHKKIEADNDMEQALEPLVQELEKKIHHECQGYKLNAILGWIWKRTQILQTDLIKRFAEKAEQDEQEINQQLEEEPGDIRAYLQSTIEELETSNKKLKSANEELLFMNKELQSSKNELLSVNKTLETVNTELKNKVKELDIANNDLKNLYESTQIATLFLDNDLAIKDFTPAATEMFRIIDSDIGRSIQDIVSRFNNVDLIAEARNVLKTLSKKSCEVKHLETDRHYMMEIFPYRAINDVIGGVTLSFVEITQLRKTKLELEIREKMLRLITDSVPVLMAYVDKSKRYRYCNSLYTKWFGYDKDDIQGKKVRDIAGEKKFKEVAPYIDKVLAGEAVSFSTTFHYPREGEKIISVHYEPHCEEDGQVTGFIVFIQDQTERVLRESKLARLAAIASSSHAEIIGKTPDGVITDWNKGASELYGYSEEEAVGQHIKLIVPPEKHQEMDQALSRLRQGYFIEPHQTVRMAKDGSIKHVKLSLAPFASKDGEVVGISSISHDISNRVNLERQLEALNEDLERRVTERTEQLHKVMTSLLSLEQNERRQFSRYLHDEIQQALIAAKMLVEQSRDIQDLNKSAPNLEGALRIIEDSIEKTKQVTMDMSPPLFFDTGISFCLQWLSKWAGNQLKLTVESRIKGTEKAIAEEAGYLVFRSIKELLLNTYKHADIDQAAILVEFTTENSLNIEVFDDGRGFDASKITEPQDDRYGLFSIMEQVRAIGGNISFKSAPGAGTKVFILMPDSVFESSENSRSVSGSKKQDLEAANRQQLTQSKDKKKILLVDDQEDLRYIIRMMIEDQSPGYVVLEAEGAQDAIEAVRELEPHLVLMDVNMPGMSGVEATKVIKKERKETKVVALSMHEREDMENAMLAAGADAYITKDGSPELIKRIIEECLRNN